jgi:DNA-binding transcriptional LysR family regulator
MQVKRLEEQIGKPIFLRERQGLTLTGEGSFLLTYARKILQLNDEVFANLESPVYTGTVRIGAPDDFATVLLPTVFFHFGEALPKVRVEVVCGNSPSLIQEVEAGNLDLALVSTLPESQGEGEIIREERLFWVMAQDSLLQNCDPLPLALFPNGCVCRNMALRALRDTNRSCKIVLASNSISTILAAVSAGLAITVMEECIMPQNTRRLTEADGFPKLGNVHITLYRRADELSKGAEILADFLTTCLRQPGYALVAGNPLSLRANPREQLNGDLLTSALDDR